MTIHETPKEQIENLHRALDRAQDEAHKNKMIAYLGLVGLMRVGDYEGLVVGAEDYYDRLVEKLGDPRKYPEEFIKHIDEQLKE